MKNPSIMTDTRICKMTIHAMPDRPGIAAEVFGRLGEAGLNVSMMTASGGASGRTEVSFTVGEEDADKTMELLEGMCEELDAESVSRRDDVVAISLVAEQMHRTPGVAGRMFRTLSTEGINIDMISATATAVTCVIDSRFLDQAASALQKEFESSTAKS
jgi:aspartate kinase